MEVLVYIFATLLEATSARNTIDEHFGIPKNQNAITTHWVNYDSLVTQTDTIYYIRYDNSLRTLMGKPDTLFIPSSIK